MKDRSEKLFGEKSASDFLFENALLDIIIPPNKKNYDFANEALISFFSDIDFSKVRSITLSKNTYGIEAIKWLSTNVISQCTYLEKANFSEIGLADFESCKLLIDSLQSKMLKELKLGGNPLGRNGSAAYGRFL